jgi:superfamily I DNA/RNA helicase
VLEGDDPKALFREAGRECSALMSSDVAEGLRQWLDEPSFAREQRDPLVLDQDQRRLAVERTPSGYRRLRGPAGSGKTCVVAARAAELAREGKKVLVVTFNITLPNYIRDLAVRWPQPGALADALGTVDYLNFHAWCKRVARQAGLDDEYRSLWSETRDESGTENGAEVDDVLATGLAQLVESALKAGAPDEISYDAILVDEGQDFRPEWWAALRGALRPAGEMLLAADASQDLYETTRRWTDEAMLNAGFTGRWAQLGISYRLPGPAVVVARRFAEEFLPPHVRLLPEPSPQGELAVDHCRLRWVAAPVSQLARAMRREIDELSVTSRQTRTGAVHPADIVVLVDEGALGREVAAALRADGIAVLDTFAEDSRRARAQKLWFFKGDGRVKATTIHSFKGWESRALVVGIHRGASDSARTIIYTALTRLRNDPFGSYLTVVSAAEDLTPFGQTWPDFHRFEVEEAPRPGVQSSRR